MARGGEQGTVGWWCARAVLHELARRDCCKPHRGEEGVGSAPPHQAAGPSAGAGKGTAAAAAAAARTAPLHPLGDAP